MNARQAVADIQTAILLVESARRNLKDVDGLIAIDSCRLVCASSDVLTTVTLLLADKAAILPTEEERKEESA